jgi:hypothetical protein
MKYACFIYGDDDPLPEGEGQKLYDASIAYHRELARKGHLLAVEALEDKDTATTVRRRDGKISMTDGPFAEIKESLGGLFIIEARDLNEAIRIAGGHPAARWDSIEIRPVRDIPKPS